MTEVHYRVGGMVLTRRGNSAFPWDRKWMRNNEIWTV